MEVATARIFTGRGTFRLSVTWWRWKNLTATSWNANKKRRSWRMLSLFLQMQHLRWRRCVDKRRRGTGRWMARGQRGDVNGFMFGRRRRNPVAKHEHVRLFESECFFFFSLSLSISSCVCVWTICIDVKLLLVVLVFSCFNIRFAGGTGPLWIPVPTKLFHNGGSGDWSPPCTCTNFHFRQWRPAKPSTGMSFGFSNFHYGLCCIWTFFRTSVSTGFNPLYGFRNLIYCWLRQMEQLLCARTKKEFFYNGFLAKSSNFPVRL